ncbi:MAG: type II CAAX prenyl endopeptidase Rce1 family protein [Gemmatimonadota bacterium]
MTSLPPEDLLPPPAPSHPGAPPAAAARRRVFPNLLQTLLLLLAFLAAIAGAALALSPLHAQVPEHLYFLGVMLLGEGAVVLVGFRLGRWPLRRVLGELGFSVRTLRRLVAIAFGNLLLIASLIYVVSVLFGPLEQEYLLELFTLDDAAEFWVLFVMVGLAAPLLEELLFRGILLRGLVSSWGATGGVLWTAFFFALIHMSPVQAAPAFVNGAVWGFVLLRTGSFGAVLFLHALNNSLVFLLVQLTMGADPRTQSPTPETLTATGAGVALVTGLAGLWLVRRAYLSLRPAPERLAELWGFPPPIAPGVNAPGTASGA